MSDEKTERFELRVPKATLATLDKVRSKEPDVPTRSEMVRRLIQRAAAPKRKEG